jgi:ribosome-binding protein aMBF1 (putative translation factor)
MDVPDFERDLEYDIATYGAIINQAREAGELSDEALAELADLDQIDIEARSYSDAVEAASICVART